jgi:rhodanese-related sulfurtransferase
MSRTAAEDLAALGYTNLKNLDGGFIAWRDAGYPFETTP